MEVFGAWLRLIDDEYANLYTNNDQRDSDSFRLGDHIDVTVCLQFVKIHFKFL